jgi:hypothetical protein
MDKRREAFEEIVPTGNLGRLYDMLACSERAFLKKAAIEEAFIAMNMWLAEVQLEDGHINVTVQSDKNVEVLNTQTGEYEPLYYSYDTEDPQIQTPYKMIYGELTGFDLEEVFDDNEATRLFLTARVVESENAPNSQFKVYIAGETDMRLSRTKLHELSEPAIVPGEYFEEGDDLRTTNWNEDARTLEWWLKNDVEESVSGEMFIETIHSMVNNGMIEDLEECVTALNISLSDPQGYRLCAEITGKVVLANLQAFASAPSLNREVDQEMMDVVSIDLYVKSGILQGDLYCYSERYERIVWSPLDERVLLSIIDAGANSTESNS